MKSLPRLLPAILLLLCWGAAETARPSQPLASTPLGSPGFRPTAQRPFGWRGDGSGRFPGAAPAVEWSATKNVRWSAVVGSSYSSPILTDQLALVTSEPNLLVGVARADGKPQWKIAVKPGDLADTKDREGARKYEPPKDGAGMAAATPVTDGRNVYAVFANGIVHAVDLEGKAKWSAWIDAEQSTGYGRSASPVLIGGKLIVHMTNLYAFDPLTGKLLWTNSDAKSTYGTPAGVTIGNVELIVTPDGDLIRAADGKTMNSGLGSSQYASPIAAAGVVYFGGNAVAAVRLDAALKEEELWSAALRSDAVGSPLLHDGTLFMVTGKGELFAFDARGKGPPRPLIEARALFPPASAAKPVTYSSLTLAGNYLFLGSNQGETVVLEATREAKLVGRNRLPHGSGASPVFSGDEMFLRDGDKLFCIGSAMSK